jgi:hypothetical protein
MTYLNRMYGASRPAHPAANSNKNPNRVAGGLRGQGSDHYTLLGEDGTEREVPSRRYVQALEDTRISVLEKKLRSVGNDQRNIALVQKNIADSINRRFDT